MILENTLDVLFLKKRKEKGRLNIEYQWKEEYNVDTQEILYIVRKRLKRHTAPSIDGVKAAYLKNINIDMMEYLAKGLTICLKNGIFPPQWKRSQLILIPKGEDPEHPKMRPICLLPEISKMFEKVIVDRITAWMEEHPDAQLSPNQYGFRRQKSTVDATMELREVIELS